MSKKEPKPKAITFELIQPKDGNHETEPYLFVLPEPTGQQGSRRRA